MPNYNLGQHRHEAAVRWAEEVREQLVKLYVIEGRSQAEVGAILGRSQTSIGDALRNLGIPAHPRWNYGERNGSFVNGLSSRLYRKVIIKEACATCGATDRLVIHHKNRDHYDNAADNLMVLCMPCHMALHKNEYWRAIKDGQEPQKSNGPMGW